MKANNQNLPDVFDQFAPPIEERHFSVGFICTLLEINPGQLRVLMESTGSKFARIVDGVAFVDGNALVEIMAECQRVCEEIAAASESVESN